MLGKLQIIEQLSKNTFAVECESCHLKFQRQKKNLKTLHRCPSIIDGQKYCYKCQTRKSLEFFHRDSTVNGGYSKLCKECYSERIGVNHYRGDKPVKRQKRTPKNLVQSTQTKIQTHLHSREQQLKYNAGRKGIEYNLPENYLYSQYIKQNGKCYYTGIPLMNYTGGINDLTLSIDKLTPNLGYTTDNVVLCLYCVNSFKGKRNEQEFKLFLREIVPSLQHYTNN